MADPLGDFLGAPFKWIGGDLPAQVLGRGVLAFNGMNPIDEPYPGYFKEISDSFVRPGRHAGTDFLNMYVNPVGMFADRKNGGYDFSAKKWQENFGTPGDAAMSALSLTTLGKVAKPVKRARTAVLKSKVDKVAKVAPKPAMPPVKDALERYAQRMPAGGK